ncbi:MAG: PT domain-containing protein, partial [Candidatus Margulisiibacteriota bacterium]
MQLNLLKLFVGVSAIFQPNSSANAINTGRNLRSGVLNSGSNFLPAEPISRLLSTSNQIPSDQTIFCSNVVFERNNITIPEPSSGSLANDFKSISDDSGNKMSKFENVTTTNCNTVYSSQQSSCENSNNYIDAYNQNNCPILNEGDGVCYQASTATEINGSKTSIRLSKFNGTESRDYDVLTPTQIDSNPNMDVTRLPKINSTYFPYYFVQQNSTKLLLCVADDGNLYNIDQNRVRLPYEYDSTHGMVQQSLTTVPDCDVLQFDNVLHLDPIPTSSPTQQPSGQPSGVPTSQPSAYPSGQPSGVPTSQPSAQPSGQPSGVPTSQPSAYPSG